MNFLKSGFGRVSKHKSFEYEPRYAEDKKESTLEEKIKFSKGSLLDKSNTLSSKRGKLFTHKDKLTNSRKWKMLVYALAMGFTIWWFFAKSGSGNWAHVAFPLVFFLVALILFIRTNNKR